MSASDALRIVAIGDVGAFETYHVGDEAMLDANLTRLRRAIPQVRFTLLSRDPQFSSQLYRSDAILPIGFPAFAEASDQASRERLEQAKRAARLRLSEGVLQGSRETLPETDSLNGVVNALAQADGLLISGGGNLSSTWAHHLYERAALIHCAAILGKPIVMTGQTIGPQLTPEHELILAQALPLVSCLGARELDTFRLALELGVAPQRVEYQLDDALFMDEEVFEDLDFDPALPFIAVTIHPFADPAGDSPLFAQLAQNLEAISAKCGARLIFIPHLMQADDNPTLSDIAVGRKIQLLMSSPEAMAVVDVVTARKVYWLTSRAAMIISTRYHPLVFGVGANVPGIGLYTDDYTRIKLGGALEHADLSQWNLPLDLAVTNVLVEAAFDLWSKRQSISRYLRALQPLWRELERAKTARICRLFGFPADESHSTFLWDAPEPSLNPDPDSSWLITP